MALSRSLFRVSFLWFTFALSAFADSAAVIAKARAYLGGEEALSSIRSIRYIGTVDTVEKLNDGSTKPSTFGIEITFQREYQQRIVLTKDALVETTALDDYEAWHRIQDKADPTRWRTVLFQKTRVKQLRASSWENLAFFSGIERIGGHVEDHGVVEIDGRSGHKLAFVHEPGIVYIRFFDPETGKLLYTETDQGVRIREEGEMVVAGVRFPRRIVNMTTLPDGSERVVTIDIDQVVVNETYPDDLFRVPLTLPN